MGSVAVLMNPTAGRGRHAHLRDQVTKVLGADAELLAVRTAEEAEAACRAAVADGARAVISVGGDGTLHRAVQAVAGTGVPLGIVPAGTGNDVAACLGVPADPHEALARAAAALESGQTRDVDLARMERDGVARWSAGVIGLGFDTLVNELANRMRFPRGPRRYDVAIVLELARMRPRRYQITVDGVREELEAVLVAVGNTARYGGGMRICPAADPTDGLLDLVVAGPVSRFTLMRIKPQVYAGTHVDHPAVRQLRGRVVEVACDGITSYADGEQSLTLPVTISAVPGALRVLG
ncbi:YegS/Rv2252/BmrU family lipid kinase [Hamadaea sp. NPDC050747]|uniref:YegS/Rv2252/BmrU family lipid kinase n=1 Tax=Hamadaea sp. NPDC050747 TaxID=3155789 RepID=UPI00340024EA